MALACTDKRIILAYIFSLIIYYPYNPRAKKEPEQKLELC